ncbi:hypothetical protein ACFLXB_10005 [Chloroflexota bacterium]
MGLFSRIHTDDYTAHFVSIFNIPVLTRSLTTDRGISWMAGSHMT